MICITEPKIESLHDCIQGTLKQMAAKRTARPGGYFSFRNDRLNDVLRLHPFAIVELPPATRRVLCGGCADPMNDPIPSCPVHGSMAVSR